MTTNHLDKLKDKVAMLPTTSGVYKMYDASGNIIYIGKAKNLKSRVSSYFAANISHEKVRQLVSNLHDFDYIVTPNELDALTLESNLVHEHMPFYNVLLKDDKAFPYLRIHPKENFPFVALTRKVKNDGALYFGPFFGKVRISDLMQIVSHTFKLRDCTYKIKDGATPRRVCLNYHMEKCLAPCAGLVSKSDYQKEVDDVIAFLKGDTKKAKSILTEKMMKCANYEQFERALEYKESLQLIDNLNNLIITDIGKLKDIDVFGYNTNGIYACISHLCIRGGKMIGVNNYNITVTEEESGAVESFVTQYYITNIIIPDTVIACVNENTLSKWLNNKKGKNVDLICPKRGINLRLLEMAEENAKIHLEKNLEKENLHALRTTGAVQRLQQVLNLPHLPVRIEAFDISNLGGTNTVASMVVFENGSPKKSHYRKFKLHTNMPNDYESMRATLARRLKNLESKKDLSFSKRPHLIVIDGGKGQLSTAVTVLKNLNINTQILAISEHDEIFLPMEKQAIVLSKNDYALNLLQRLRNESHRFALNYQRTLRISSSLKSELENIPLVGGEKIKELFIHFKSLNAIKKASISELMQAKGIGKKLAQNIYNYFNKSENNK